MNYSINLLKDSEKRSVAMLSARSIIRIIYIVVPLLCVFAIGAYFLNYFTMQQQVKDRKTHWSLIKNKEKMADLATGEYNFSADVLKEIKDWDSRGVQVYEVLINLMVETPDDIYLKTFDLQRLLTLNEQNALESYYEASIKGIIYGSDAQARVVKYKNMLQTSIGLQDFIESVDIDSYDENLSSKDDLEDKVFLILIESTKKVSK
ncbi:MAG: hypothetical protein PF692_02855 [Kiritimatiellae bacterium]|jgi:hypothetical protein|nr:hypothetical protein [Kiritimatiellia bacterium]